MHPTIEIVVSIFSLIFLLFLMISFIANDGTHPNKYASVRIWIDERKRRQQEPLMDENDDMPSSFPMEWFLLALAFLVLLTLLFANQ